MTKKQELPTKEFTYVSLFSGVGGFEQALNKLGGTCVLASEIDKHANKAYEALYNEPTVGDITAIKSEDVPDHDLLVGGFPCQAFSVAGKRGGFKDARGTLFFEMARIAAEKKPKAILAENVKGLVGHDKGRTLDTIVKTLNDIGYRVDFEVLNSKYFGVPQNRERIFILAIREDLIENEAWTNTKGMKIVPKGKRRLQGYRDLKSFNFDWPEQTTVESKLVDVLETKVDGKYYLSDEKTARLISRLEESDKEDAPNILHNIYGGFEEKKPRVFKEESPTIRTAAGGGHLPSLLEAKPEEIASPGDLSYCLDASYHKGTAPSSVGKGRRTQVLESGYKIRRLTPLECFRLQGFDDEVHEKLVEAGISDTQRYKMAGNAVTVNVIEAIATRILAKGLI